MASAREEPLLERAAELDAIGLRLDRAREGDGSLVVIEGPAGIGKTALVGAAAAIAREREMIVLHARGGVLEQLLQYGVARQLLEKTVLRAEPERRARLLVGPRRRPRRRSGSGSCPRIRESVVTRRPRSSTRCTGSSPTWPRRRRS